MKNTYPCLFVLETNIKRPKIINGKRVFSKQSQVQKISRYTHSNFISSSKLSIKIRSIEEDDFHSNGFFNFLNFIAYCVWSAEKKN